MHVDISKSKIIRTMHVRGDRGIDQHNSEMRRRKLEDARESGGWILCLQCLFE